MFVRKAVFLISLLFLAKGASCQEELSNERCNDPNSKIECGWHYGYIDPLGELEIKEEIQPTTTPAPPPEPDKEEEKCTSKDNWSEECGFVDPGEDFDFQAMQRDIFLKNLLMKSNDPKSVENMQRYQKWLVSKAVQASKMWEFNLAQKPELSASVNNPVTSFGLTMASQLRDDTTESVLEEIRGEKGVYVWFTRSDCPFCHRQIMTMKDLEREFDIEVRNVSLDQTCMNGFEDDCISAPDSIEPAKALKIEIVPSFFVYMPKDKTWIRISNGIDSKSTIIRRITNFFIGVKSAHLNGVDNGSGNTPSVDFSKNERFRINGIKKIKVMNDEG